MQWIVVACVLLAPPLAAQPQEVINERVERLARDVSRLEAMRIDQRLVLLEESMYEIKWLGRSIATIMIGQLAVAIRQAGRRRRLDRG